MELNQISRYPKRQWGQDPAGFPSMKQECTGDGRRLAGRLNSMCKGRYVLQKDLKYLGKKTE